MLKPSHTANTRRKTWPESSVDLPPSTFHHRRSAIDLPPVYVPIPVGSTRPDCFIAILTSQAYFAALASATFLRDASAVANVFSGSDLASASQPLQHRKTG